MANEPIVFKFKNPEAPNTLYLDRDGVLNDVIIRGTEISSPRKLKEIKITNDLDIFEKPEILNKWNFVIISNQPDIERGLIDEKFLEEVNNRIRLRIQLNAAYICPHHKLDNCSCRKPKTGLIDRFRLDYPHIKGQE